MKNWKEMVARCKRIFGTAKQSIGGWHVGQLVVAVIVLAAIAWLGFNWAGELWVGANGTVRPGAILASEPDPVSMIIAGVVLFVSLIAGVAVVPILWAWFGTRQKS